MRIGWDEHQRERTVPMKYLDEYRDPALARRLLKAIQRTATRPWTLMEVCGGQTHTVVRSGIDRLMPNGVPRTRPGLPGVCDTVGTN
jgi:hydrogenase expression/formation protein HypD